MKMTFLIKSCVKRETICLVLLIVERSDKLKKNVVAMGTDD